MTENDRRRWQDAHVPVSEDVISPEVYGQVAHFLNPFIEANELRPEVDKRLANEYESLGNYFVMYAIERNVRAREIETQEYEEVVETAKEQLPFATYEKHCIDDRVTQVIKYGFTAGISNAIRIPGGMSRDFVRDETTQQIKLNPNSNFTIALDNAFNKHDVVAQLLDSHLGCAARERKETGRKGSPPEDHGLYRDVVEKRQMAQAMRRYTFEKYQGSKQVVPIQTSFDPHSGYMFMGLETQPALEYAQKHAADNENPVYSEQILKELVQRGMIISTAIIAEHPEVDQVFKENAFPVNWKINYSKSAKNFWERTAHVKDRVTPIIKEELIRVYPFLQLEKFQGELEERAMLLLANAFSGFLNNQDGSYPYAKHEEEGVEITEGGYGPHNTSTFEVSSLEPDGLSESTQLAIGLVRTNRTAGRVRDISHNFPEPKKFAAVIVPTVVAEIIRNPEIKVYGHMLSLINWSDMPTKWNSMSPEEFASYIAEKQLREGFKFPDSLKEAVESLRQRMIILYERRIISESLINQDSIAMPVIVDKSRRVIGVVPFIKVGY